MPRGPRIYICLSSLKPGDHFVVMTEPGDCSFCGARLRAYEPLRPDPLMPGMNTVEPPICRNH